MPASPVNKQCCAILVSFNPEAQVLLALVAQVSKQCSFVLIDNASSNASEFLTTVEAQQQCIAAISLDENIGLAAALNIGLKQAMEHSAQFAILFDQDSAIPDDFVVGLL